MNIPKLTAEKSIGPTLSYYTARMETAIARSGAYSVTTATARVGSYNVALDRVCQPWETTADGRFAFAGSHQCCNPCNEMATTTITGVPKCLPIPTTHPEICVSSTDPRQYVCCTEGRLCREDVNGVRCLTEAEYRDLVRGYENIKIPDDITQLERSFMG